MWPLLTLLLDLAATIPTPTWSDQCETRLRAAATSVLPREPVYSWRDKPTEWGAQSYDAFISACAENPALLLKVASAHGKDEGLVVAVGKKLLFRVVLIPYTCEPRASRNEPWFDKQKYWEPAELNASRSGVSIALHTDPAPAARKTAKRFIERMRPIIDDCVSKRAKPQSLPMCSPVPG